MRCTFCGSEKHTEKNCPRTWQGIENRRRMVCAFCWARGHTEKACPQTWQGNAIMASDPESVADEFIKDADKGG